MIAVDFAEFPAKASAPRARCRSAAALALFGLVAAAACTNSTAPVLDGLTSAQAMAVVCVEGPKLYDPVNCKADSELVALVGGGTHGSLALGSPGAGTFLDTNPSVPGITGLQLPGEPVSVAADTATRQAFVAIGANLPQIAAVDLGQLSSNRLALTQTAPLPFAPADIALFDRTIDDKVQRWMAVADPAGGKVWVAPMDKFADASAWQPWPVGGSPVSLRWLGSRSQLWIGHLHHGYVSVWHGDKAVAVGQPISIDAACQNGLDDDGDGKTDGADPGCDRGSDGDETDPETGPLCSNGADDDGNGLTDAADPSCAPTETANACRNGIDDDGDGKTDLAQDPGCADWADSSEFSDNPACADGFDNDGDGKTDSADPDCAAGNEWPQSAADRPPAALPACANGIDDDGDGLADLADPDCRSRGGQTEAGNDRTPQTRLGATIAERYVAAAHQGRREVLFIDAETRQLLLPKRGEPSPFLRASRLDERDGVMGLATGTRPTAITGMDKAGAAVVGIATSPGGLAVAQVTAGPDAPVAIQWIVSTASTATVPSKPALLIDRAAVDLGASIPARYPSLGPLRTEARADGTAYNGIQPSTESAEHRTEQWTATFEGRLPGPPQGRGRWLGPALLHDPFADFCAEGAVAGDWMILPAGDKCPSAPALKVRIAEVRGDAIAIDLTTAQPDVPYNADSQLAADLAEPPTQPFAPAAIALGCWSHGQVPYHLRADGWLLAGSRSGVLSQRGRSGNVCAPLPLNELAGARIAEPKLRQTPAGPQRPASCPYALGVLDPAFDPVQTNTPIFSHLQIQPGCRTRTLASGKPAVAVLPSIRDAQWVWNLSAGYRPNVTSMGSENAVLVAGPKLTYVYGLDVGAGALFAVDPTGANLSKRIE